MRSVVTWFAENSVAANLLMLVVVGSGLLAVGSVRQEVFPEIELDMVSVSVRDPGASPADVEEAVCVRIEEAIEGIEGIQRLSSTSAEGVGAVIAELLTDADPAAVLDDIKAAVDAIDTFPEEVEEPVIKQAVSRRQVIDVAVSGDVPETTLKAVAEQVRDEIVELPGITQVMLRAVRPYEISIEVSEEALRRYGITFGQVARAVRSSSLDLPGGSLKTGGGEILVRTKGQAYRGRQFEELVLSTRADGTRLLLREVARVVDGFADTDQAARFDGHPTALIQVFRVGQQSALEVAGAVKRYVARAQARMPAGVRLTTWRDDSLILQSRLDLMLRNGRAGFVLVFLILALFLRLRLALWVSLGIPVSFLGALWLMPVLDVSINLVSLFAFIVVLGIIVDDAIVVGENVYTHMQQGKPPLRAAIDGTLEVMLPVAFAVLTTVAAFAPLLGVTGSMGKVMRVIPLIVIPALGFSLIESQLVLPAHLAHSGGAAGRGAGGGGRRGGGAASAGLLAPLKAIGAFWSRVQIGFARRFDRFIERLYQPSLRVAMEWRYLTVAWGVVTLLVTVGLVGGGWIHFTFFPKVEADYVAAMLTMPQGTPAEATAQAVRRLEESAARLRAELDGAGRAADRRIFRHMMTAVGEQPYRAASNHSPAGAVNAITGAHLGEVTIELAPSERRSITSAEIASRWRQLTGAIPDAVELLFTSSLFTAGEPINVQLTSNDLDALRSAATALKQRLVEYSGVFDVTDSFRAGKQELQLRIKPAAESLGLTLADLARQVRQGFYGEEAQRVQRGRDDVKVMVRYPEDERRSLGDLEDMRIRTPNGGEVPFGAVAEVEIGRGFDVIRRTDRRRAVNVTADVDIEQGNANEILADLQRSVLPQILADHPGVSYSFEGQQREQRDTLGDLVRGFAVALLLIYALLAVPFKSYVQPLIVMLAIPFGIVGAIWGHVIMGMNLTIVSLFGIVALAGVVVNDSLVLIDYVNRRRREGMPLGAAVQAGGVARFRPILLTSLTTFGGLTPLLLERSVQAQFLIPMAISLGFGVMFATFITLVLVPAGYLIIEDVKELPRRWRRRRGSSPNPSTTSSA